MRGGFELCMCQVVRWLGQIQVRNSTSLNGIDLAEPPSAVEERTDFSSNWTRERHVKSVDEHETEMIGEEDAKRPGIDQLY